MQNNAEDYEKLIAYALSIEILTVENISYGVSLMSKLIVSVNRVAKRFTQSVTRIVKDPTATIVCVSAKRIGVLITQVQ